MATSVPTLESVRGDLDQLREVARKLYTKHPERHADGGAWTLNDYLTCIDGLDEAITHALSLEPCSRIRFEAEKFARNRIAQQLYYRGRVCLKTNALGRFHKKSGDKNIHWAPTELSRQADRLAAEPLRQIYKQTETCMRGE